jgi:hypothetical protein
MLTPPPIAAADLDKLAEAVADMFLSIDFAAANATISPEFL